MLARSKRKPTKPAFTPRAKRVEDLDREINDFCESRIGYRPIVRGSQAQAKGQKPTTAIAVRPAAVVTVEATGSERRKLTSDFEKAWLALGRNFLVLGETVLRAEEGGMSVDDLIGVTGLTAARSTAYAARKATKLWRIFQPFAEPAGIVLDCESQFRDFPAELDLTPPEARKIVKLIEKEVEADKRGQHRPTREQLKPIIAATVGLRGIGPEKRKPQAAADSRLREPSAKMPSGTATADPPMEASEPAGMFARGIEPGHRDSKNLTALGTSDEWQAILLGTPADGSLAGWWRGQPRYYAPQLVGLDAILQRLINTHLGQHDEEVAFRRDLARLLDLARKELASHAEPAPAAKVARRAK